MTTIIRDAVRIQLSPLAAEVLDAAVQLGQALTPLTLFVWADGKADDPRQPAARRAAARELALATAHEALGVTEWR
jgi:hypothetical protein